MTLPQRVVLSALIICFFVGLSTGATFYYHLGYFWGFVLLSSWLLSRHSLRKIDMKRVARNLRSQVGQIFEERYELINQSRLPRLWIEVRDESQLIGAKSSRVLSLIKGKENRSYLVRTRLIERGVFPLGPTRLSSGDIFGMFPTNISFPVQNSLLVYPMMVDISTFPAPAGWLSGGEAIRRRTHQITPNAAGVRDYAPGDPLNRIHWLSTARRNKFIVKEFELDPLAEVWLFLDANLRVHYSRPYSPPKLDVRDQWRPTLKIALKPSTIEYAVTCTASLTKYFLKKGRSVGFVSVDRTLKLLPSDRGSRQLGKILETLALIKGEGDLPIEGVVEAQSQNISRGSTVILISPAVGNSLPLAVENLVRRGFHPIVVLINSESFGGSPGVNDTEETLANIKIPYCIISEGDDLSVSLSQNIKLGVLSNRFFENHRSG